MPLDEEELQEQLFEDIGLIKDVLNVHSAAFVEISSRLNQVLEAVTKEAEGDALCQLLRDIHAALERNNVLLAQVDARLSKAG